MKIVIDARRIHSTTGRYVRELLNHLQVLDSDNEYHVLIHTKDQGHWAPTADNFYLHVVPWDFYTLGEQLGLARFIQKLKPDLVHFYMPQQPLLYFGKRVTTIHDLTLVRFKNLDKNKVIYAIEQNIFKFLIKNVARRSKQVITPTNYVKKDVAEYTGISLDKITVTLESSVDHKAVKVEPIKKLTNKDFLFYVGNAFPHKNLQSLVDSLEGIRKKHPKIQLVVAGKKDFFHKQLEQYIKTNKVPGVHFLGFVSEGELAWLYKHAQAYVFPSLSEGFGLPGLEAMQHGLPVISSDATCLPEVYGDAAHYFDPKSVNSIISSVDEVLRSKARRAELTKAGYIQLKKYSWLKMAKQTHKTYLKSLGQ